MHIEGYNEATPPTHDDCNRIRIFFIRNLNLYYRSFHDEDDERQGIHATMSEWFSHEGFVSKARDDKIGEKMARIVFVQVGLANDGGRIECRDRITSFDAPSRPLN